MEEIVKNGIEKGIIQPIDQLLANQFSTLYGNDLAIKLLLIHLSFALRSGKTSLIRHKVKGGHTIYPTVDQLWQPSDEAAAAWLKEHSRQIEDYIEQGWLNLLGLKKRPQAVYCTETILQWQKWRKARIAIERLIALRLSVTPSIEVDMRHLDKLVCSWQDQGLLNEQQAEVIRVCAGSTICLVSGGPGTGKTYTAAFIVQMVQELKQQTEKEPKGQVDKRSEESKLRCALAAPTGKAAANLTQRIHAQLIRQGASLPELYSSTIHSLIASAERASSSLQILPYDLIIVDESSMIDELMMAKLLLFTGPRTRLVFMGDHYQLPPVEPGAPFKDLVFELNENQESCRGVFLTQCVRTDVAEIMQVSSLLRLGRKKEVKELLEATKKGSALFWRYRKLPNGPQRVIGEIATRLQQNEYSCLGAALSLLTPMRQGSWGTQALNDAIRVELLKRWKRSEPFIVPIMVTVNDYKLQLFNGDTGILVMENPYQRSEKEDYALFFSPDPKEPKRRFSAVVLPRYEFAWCLSVHKSQGSEFDTVIVLLPSGSEYFGDELLYTAVTRAKSKVEIWGAI